MEVTKEDVFQVILFAIELLDQKVAHAVVVFRQRPISAVNQQILALPPYEIDAALDVAVEFVIGERPMDAGNAPTIRRLRPKEYHPATPLNADCTGAASVRSIVILFVL